jgi:hypothetical protein
MDKLSPHKSFPNLDDVRSLPRVLKSTPIPHRESPLPGTKSMLCPKDKHLLEMVTGPPTAEPKPPLTATIMGVLAMVVALGSLAYFWQLILSDRSYSRSEGWMFFPGFAVVHLLWLFSRILSVEGSRLGCLAVVMLYLGPLVLGFIASFVS